MHLATFAYYNSLHLRMEEEGKWGRNIFKTRVSGVVMA